MSTLNSGKIIPLLQRQRDELQAQTVMLLAQREMLQAHASNLEERLKSTETLLDAAKQLIVEDGFRESGLGLDNPGTQGFTPTC